MANTAQEKAITFRCPADLYEAVRKNSVESDRSMGATARLALKAYLNGSK